MVSEYKTLLSINCYAEREKLLCFLREINQMIFLSFVLCLNIYYLFVLAHYDGIFFNACSDDQQFLLFSFI